MFNFVMIYINKSSIHENNNHTIYVVIAENK